MIKQVIEIKQLPAAPKEFESQAAKQQGQVELLTPHTIELLTAKQAAERLHVHPVTLLRWAREGCVPHCRPSKRTVLFPVSELNAWIRSRYHVSAVHAAPTPIGVGA